MTYYILSELAIGLYLRELVTLGESCVPHGLAMLSTFTRNGSQHVLWGSLMPVYDMRSTEHIAINEIGTALPCRVQ